MYLIKHKMGAIGDFTKNYRILNYQITSSNPSPGPLKLIYDTSLTSQQEKERVERNKQKYRKNEKYAEVEITEELVEENSRRRRGDSKKKMKRKQKQKLMV